jgi:O-antigen/teichoic acid export membrane protein
MGFMAEDAAPRGDRLSAAELQRRAVAGSTWTAVHTVVSLPVAFVANAIVARSLGVSSYGDLAFLTAALGLTFVLVSFGFPTALVQAGSRAESGGRRAEADELLRRSLGFHLVVELPLLVVVAYVLTRGGDTWEFAAVSAAVLLTSVFNTAALSVTIENRTAAGAKLAIVVNLVLQAIAITVAVGTESASAVWAARTLAAGALLAATLLLLDPERRRTVLTPRLPRALGRPFWRFAISSWAAGVVGLLVFSRSEIFILQAFDKPEALGLFALAFGLSQQITAPVDAMLHALTPAVAGVLSEWPERAAAAFERSTRVASLLSGGIAAVVVPALVFAIPLIYGSSFDEVSWLFVPLALVSMLQSVNNPVIAFVHARQRGGLILRASVFALIVNVGVAVALIPAFGAWGAVVANAIGQVVVLAWLAVSEPLVAALGLGGMLRLYRSFLAGVVVACVALAAGAMTQSISAALAAAIAFAVGAGLYVVLVRILRGGLSVEDRDALLGAFSPRLRASASRLLAPITNR